LLAGIGVPQPFGSRAARQMSLKANQYCVADVTKLRDSRFNFEKKADYYKFRARELRHEPWTHQMLRSSNRSLKLQWRSRG
jgi:hypothetical protein